VDPDRSEGRYVLKTGKFMDPEIFKKDRPVTVAGTMTGVRKGLIENYEYGYPVIEILEIKAWEDSGAAFPQIYFGIGVGTWF
jgi:outer membrane lipoprotein